MRPCFPGNTHLYSAIGRRLDGLAAINALDVVEKESIYASLLPPRLFSLLNVSPKTFCNTKGQQVLKIIAPEGMTLLRMELRLKPDDRRPVFFLDLTETHFHQMELAFCIIRNPFAISFNVDLDENGNCNYFASNGRNIPQEQLAMEAGLFPNQTSRGLSMFGEFFKLLELFTDALGMSMIVAEPLTYDNAIRFEKYGFEYLSGRRLMQEIDKEFKEGGELFKRLDGSTPFRQKGMERTVFGRSWALHDGIRNEPCKNEFLSQPWEEVKIYKTIGL